MTTNNQSFETFPFLGIALDPIHVGTGGIRLGRVDNTIVRDPVTKIPKIPGSSLAGVMRAYTAMEFEKYPGCAGLGQPDRDGTGGHCGKPDCPICTVFGFAKGMDVGGGFAGLAGFSDMQVLMFPVASQLGPQWITSPIALQPLTCDKSIIGDCFKNENIVYQRNNTGHLNLGWLNLEVETWQNWGELTKIFKRFNLPKYILDRLGFVSDKLFFYLVNNNLEVRTSVAINPATGAAEEGALFTYEALPRHTILTWQLICRNPKHFKINKMNVDAVKSPQDVKEIIAGAYNYLEHLGIGGMGSRGMGRLQVLENNQTGQ